MYDRDNDGNVTNPPTIRRYETELADAHNSADASEIERITEEYGTARDDKVKRDEDRARRNDQSEDERRAQYDAQQRQEPQSQESDDDARFQQQATPPAFTVPGETQQSPSEPGTVYNPPNTAGR